MIEDPQRRRWHRRSLLPTKYEDVRLAELEVPDTAVGPVKTFMDAFAFGETAGVGLALTGKPGRGKTTLACAIVNELVKHAPKRSLGHAPDAAFSMERPLLFVEYASYLTYQRQLIKLEAKGQITSEEFNRLDLIVEGVGAICPNDTWNPRLVVLDDLGKEHSTRTRWAEDTFDEVLRHRFNRGFPTIVTSNEPVKRWTDIYSPAMGSFAREAFVEVAVLGEDRRG